MVGVFAKPIDLLNGQLVGSCVNDVSTFSKSVLTIGRVND